MVCLKNLGKKFLLAFFFNLILTRVVASLLYERHQGPG